MRPAESSLVPEWASFLFKDFIDRAERVRHLSHISRRGIQLLVHMPKFHELLADPNDPDHETRLAKARADAKLAEREVAENFPLLGEQALVSLWAALEDCIRLFLARCLEHREGAFQVDAVQKLRVKISDYEGLIGEQKYFYILDRLEQETSATLKAGINRFEVLLGVFGFSGETPDSIGRDLFELCSVRNCIVHRGGYADKRFADACPWTAHPVGKRITVDQKMLERFFSAAIAYVTLLIDRIGEAYGANRSEDRAAIKFRAPGSNETGAAANPA